VAIGRNHLSFHKIRHNNKPPFIFYLKTTHFMGEEREALKKLKYQICRERERHLKKFLTILV